MLTIYMDDKTKLPARITQDVYKTKDIGLIEQAIWRYAPTDAIQILDVGAGDGRWGEFAKVACPKAQLTGIDIRDLPKPPMFDSWYQIDASSSLGLLEFSREYFDLIVSNPPFYCAAEIIKNLWPIMAYNSTMIMLLKLEFMNSQNRYNHLWAEYSPIEVAPVVKRVEFTGLSNLNEVAVFIWQKVQGENQALPFQWKTHLLLHQRKIRE